VKQVARHHDDGGVVNITQELDELAYRSTVQAGGGERERSLTTYT